MTLEPRPPEPGPSPRVVRPYVLTQGRTKAPESTYGLEAQVRALVPPTQLDRAATPEARRIVELCQRATSVAEVAARMTLPLGVARVLVGDLAAAGYLRVHQTTADRGESGPGRETLRRLLDGLRTR